MLKEVSLADLPSYISLSQGFLSIMAYGGQSEMPEMISYLGE